MSIVATMRPDEGREGTALASMVSRRLRLAETIADIELTLRRLTALYASLALGLSVGADAMADIWATLGARTVGLRRSPGDTLTLTLTFDDDREVVGQGPTLVKATLDAIGCLRTRRQTDLTEWRESIEDLDAGILQLERCFGCAGPPGSCATCTPRPTTTAASAA